jgi:glycosyltransferase involved in cell wall biosynthesis
LPIADERAATFHNALDPAFLAAGAGAGSCKRPFEVVMLSYNRAYKGVPEFVALADRLLARHDIRFHLVLSDGAGELAGMPQPANLTIHPPSDRPETFYRRAGAVLNLSRPDLCVETFGLTLLEAMAFGVPVIAPPVGGPAELVRDGCEGYLIDSREGQALADAVERLTDDDVTYRAMSLAARARAQQFDVPRFRAALFDTIAAARQTRQRPGKAMS